MDTVPGVKHDIPGPLRTRELSGQQRKLEEEVEGLKKELNSSQQTNQALIDEHHALQLAYNSHEKKLKEVEAENDRLVSDCIICSTLSPSSSSGAFHTLAEATDVV